MRLISIAYIGCCLLYGCATVQYTSIGEEKLKSMAIASAIEDYSSSLSANKDSVFFVKYHDSVFFEASIVKDGNVYRFLRGSLYEGVIAVTVLPVSEWNFLYGIDSNGTLRQHTYPTKVLIINNKLFYWDLKQCELSPDIISILAKYHLLQDDEDGILDMPDNPINDGIKGTVYYYGRRNPGKFKRRTSRVAIGFERPPRIKRKYRIGPLIE